MAWKEPPLKRAYACNVDVLVYLRERRGWTQQQLGKVTGYSERLISKAEAGKTVSTATIADLADAFSTADKPIYPEDLISDPVKLAKEYIAAVYSQGKRMVDAIQHFLADDVVFRIAGDPEQIPFAGEHRGIEAVRRSLDIFFSILEAPADHDHEPHYRFFGQGNEVSMWGESWIHPIGQPMEKPISISHRFVFQRGKLILLEDVFDTLAGKEALQGN